MDHEKREGFIGVSNNAICLKQSRLRRNWVWKKKNEGFQALVLSLHIEILKSLKRFFENKNNISVISLL